MKKFLAWTLFMLSFSSLASDACENFASYYSVNAVMSEMVLNSEPIYTSNFYPQAPQLLSTLETSDTYVKTFTTVISVSPKESHDVATRYYVTLKLNDHGASCTLVEDSIEIDLEN